MGGGFGCGPENIKGLEQVPGPSLSWVPQSPNGCCLDEQTKEKTDETSFWKMLTQVLLTVIKTPT